MQATSVLSGSYWKRISLPVKLAFLSAFVMTFLTHGYSFATILINADGMGRFFWQYDGLSSGRWFLSAAEQIANPLTLPWFSGVMCALFIALGAALTVSLLGITKPIPALLTGMLCASFPAATLQMTYEYQRGVFFLGQFLMILGLFCVIRHRWGFLLGIPCMILSLGVYQAYLGYGCGLAVLCLLREAWSKRELSFKPFFLKCLKYLCCLAAAVALYYLVWMSLLHAAGGSASDGYIANLSQRRDPLGQSLLNAYLLPFTFFLRDSAGHCAPWMPWLFGAALVVTALLLGWILVCNRALYKPWRWAMIGLLFVLLPLACNVLYIYPGVIFGRMMYSLLLFMVLPFVMCEDLPDVTPPPHPYFTIFVRGDGMHTRCMHALRKPWVYDLCR